MKRIIILSTLLALLVSFRTNRGPIEAPSFVKICAVEVENGPVVCNSYNL